MGLQLSPLEKQQQLGPQGRLAIKNEVKYFSNSFNECCVY